MDGPECSEPDCHAAFRAIVFNEFFFAQALVPAAMSGGRTSERNSLKLATRIQVGRRFRAGCLLRVEVAALGNHAAAWTGQLRFADLPKGTHIASCQGYAESPTPVRASTWGRLKAAYC